MDAFTRRNYMILFSFVKVVSHGAPIMYQWLGGL